MIYNPFKRNNKNITSFVLRSDKNECTETSHNCDTKAECQNTEGSFTCICYSGYTGNGIMCEGNVPFEMTLFSGYKKGTYFSWPLFK